jgi:hypothetical protein
MYEFSRVRGKNTNGVSIGTLRKLLYVETGGACRKCARVKKLSQLDLDHIIPIAIGGDRFTRENVQLLCGRCHLEKTILDKRVIRSLRALGVVELMAFVGASYIPLSDLHALFRTLFGLAAHSQKEALADA